MTRSSKQDPAIATRRAPDGFVVSIACWLLAWTVWSGQAAAQSVPAPVGGGTAHPAASTDAGASSGWEALAKYPVGHGSRTVKGGSLQGRLPLAAEAAFLDWGRFALGHGWRVSVDPEGVWLLIGSASAEAFGQAGDALEAACDLLASVQSPRVDEGPTICFLFDEGAARSAAWPALLDALVARRTMERRMAEALRADPAGFTLRAAGLFVQPAFDQAGDAAAGDDEFRLGNEVAHKAAQCVLRRRFGVQPEMVRWGVGYVVEQRLFGTSYQFGQSGFVAAESHSGWAARAADALKQAGKDKSFRFSALVPRSAEAGSASPSQLLVWAALESLLAQDPALLAGLLSDLSALQREADVHGLAFDWQPSEARTAAACAVALDGLDPKALAKSFAKARPPKPAKRR